MHKKLLISLTCLLTLACDGNADVYSPRNKTEVCHIENASVQNVMALSNAQFSPENSCIPQALFDDDSLAYRPDQPQGYTISFTDAAATQAQVTLSRGLNRSSKTVLSQMVSLEKGKGSFCFTNLLPNETYHYTVTALGRKTLAEGSFQTKGQLRMIALDGGFNIRDLGGWRGLNGCLVEYGKLYRGGSLGGTDKDGNRSDISEAGKAELQRLGIGAQLDLRAATNQGKYPEEGSLHSYSAGQAPLPSMDFNNTMTDYGAYNGDGSVVSDVAWIIYELKRGRSVYFNCRQGADRTGTIAFIIEGLLGCYDQAANTAGGNQLAMDYEMTGFSRANLVDNWKVATSCRPASEAYTNKAKLFRQLIDLEAAEPDIQLTTLQQKCYYYLNRYTNAAWTKEALHIDAADLDWFIQHLLKGMTTKQYAAFRPQWATTGNDLKQVAEQHANIVTYAPRQQRLNKK